MSRERQEKKEQFSQPRNKGVKGKVIVLVAIVAVALGLGGFLYTQEAEDGGYSRVESVNGEVRIALDRISDGQAHYFTYPSAQGTLQFFVIKSSDGVIRAAFDACDVCYREKKGYRQEGEMMVCNNCGQKFHSSLINVVKGGCNPAPLNRRIEGDQLVIRDRDLLTGAWFFNG